MQVTIARGVSLTGNFELYTWSIINTIEYSMFKLTISELLTNISLKLLLLEYKPTKPALHRC